VKIASLSIAILFTLAACGRKQAPSKTAGADSASGATAAWHDPSPHTVRFVTVANGVRLEILDWGGQGAPLVFLAGLGNTGHVFDDFAPRFMDRYHVIAITRRGFGASDQPATGYTMSQLASDVHVVLDSLHISRVALAGHSIAGQELTWVAVGHPGDVGRLVYLDAGFDYHAHPVPGPFPPPPQPTAADSASIAAELAFARRMSAPIPEAEFRAIERVSPAGRDLGSVTPDSIGLAIQHSAFAVAPPLGQVRVPTLALYAKPVSISDNVPWMTAADTAAARVQHNLQAWRRAQLDEFAAKVPQARIVEIPGATHYVFLIKPDSVEREMRAFLAN
jgi:pimeloyl-ACP methyl ester carboxylesterase